MTGNLSHNQLKGIVQEAISENKLKGAAVYVLKDLLHPLRTYQFSRTAIAVKETSLLLFADLQPGANWSHEALFIVYDGTGIQKIAAAFPPPAEGWRLLMRPPAAEDWMLVTNEVY
jgi:hypothetical protein